MNRTPVAEEASQGLYAARSTAAGRPLGLAWLKQVKNTREKKNPESKVENGPER